MSGSESKSEHETKGSAPNEANRPSLADFLGPPRPRSSIPAPSPEAESAPIAATTTAVPSAPVQAKAEPAGSDDPSSAVTPTEPTTLSDAPAPLPAAAALRAAEVRPSVAPSSSNDTAARSLIPVATNAETPDEVDDDYPIPGSSAPWSGAAVRRATFVALLAAAAAVPAWVVFRARNVDVPARIDAPGQKGTAAPSTLQPVREIEADDDQDDPDPAASAAVAADPVKGLELRREARRLLESGQINEGVATARRAIETNPADPECYVLLAAGLQDQGRWAESREVFSRCIHKSSDGINAECVYFATSGTLTNR